MRARRIRSPLLAAARAAALACLVCPVLTGCKNRSEQRAGVAFHAKGVRLGVRRVRDQIEHPELTNRDDRTPGRGDYYAMKVATDHLARALGGLPGRIEKKAAARKAERKAAAEKAGKIFSKLSGKLESLNYDKKEALARLDEILKLVDEAERTQ